MEQDWREDGRDYLKGWEGHTCIRYAPLNTASHRCGNALEYGAGIHTYMCTYVLNSTYMNRIQNIYAGEESRK